MLNEEADMGASDVEATRGVRKRAVCYIPGYDPRGPRFYHRMFRRESKKQAKVSGYAVTVGKSEEVNERVSQWPVEHESKDGERTEIAFSNFNYDNMIWPNWEKSSWKISLSLFRMGWVYVSNGYLLKGWKMGLWSMITIIFPVFIGFIKLLAIVLGAWLIFALTEWHWAVKVGSYLTLVGGAIWMGRALDKKFNLDWLTRTGRFFTYHKYPVMAENLEVFKDYVLQLDKRNEYDEIIVVGHSMGSVLAAQVMAKALESDPEFGKRKAEVNLLTVGSVIGMIAGVNSNKDLISNLDKLNDETRIDWVEFTAKVDGANVHMKHPLCLQGKWNESYRLPRSKAARFFKSNTAEEYQRLLDDRLRLHFQYILAQELPQEYDYFAMVTGPRFLRDLFPESTDS